jgi:hypothetical protein
MVSRSAPYRHHPYAAERGWLTRDLKILAVRHGAKYDATNRLMLLAAKVRRLYHVRSQIAAVIRIGKDQFGLPGCQARSERV